ncbi:hypothetical protein ANN_13057 [Periplaneta americana]|uniref:Tc1-like transposase DDE domain-containing protein n=1 Tax=Periplaneta americana TaxID=6978 RepID=A0ABQ8TJP5_PERAM|nr:hypothetical protein ANN_13057 [Periplaneta americana]
MGFEFTRRKKNSMLIDRDDIIAWRHWYLRATRNHRANNRNIVYTDGTWINAGCTTSKSWMDTTITSASQARKEGLTTGNKMPSGKGGRIILVHADKLLPNLPVNSVIVLDNASVHSRKDEKIPVMRNNKAEIRSWLISKAIPVGEDMHKIELLEMVASAVSI